jgi:hypothetical protein
MLLKELMAITEAKKKHMSLDELQSFITTKLGKKVEFSFDTDDEDLTVIFERDLDAEDMDAAEERQGKLAAALVKALEAKGMSAHSDSEDGDTVVKVQYTHYDED